MSDGDPSQLLPESDRDFLAEKGMVFDVAKENGEILLVIHDFPFPATYQPTNADLLIVIPAGYPNAQLDMFWSLPDVKLANGHWPAQAEQHQAYLGKSWQRWSRHFQQPWRPRIDGIKTFVASVRAELGKGI